MKQYFVIALAVNIAGGILALNKDQAESRVHCLEDLGDGLYEVRKPVQFKHGEEFGYDGEINKALLQELEETAENPLSAKELIEQIETAETFEALENLLSGGESRKTVLAAFETKKAELEMGGE